MTVFAFLLSASENGVPVILVAIAMGLDTLIIITYMIGRMLGAF